MRLLDENYEEISESDVDLSLGRIDEAMIIKENATPIDNITKFAWYKEDYETVKIYHKFTKQELERFESSKIPSVNERITALEQENAMLLECILEMSEIIYA